MSIPLIEEAIETLQQVAQEHPKVKRKMEIVQHVLKQYKHDLTVWQRKTDLLGTARDALNEMRKIT